MPHLGGQAVILQRHLESDAANLLAPSASPSKGEPDKPPPDDLLQIALQHKVAPTLKPPPSPSPLTFHPHPNPNPNPNH